MSQINTNFQDILSNNNRTAIITSETLQGFSMANQFAICANSGSGPVLLSCLTPMLLPTLTGNNKGTFELTGGDNRNQNQQQTVQIQLASPFNLAGNLCGGNNGQSLPSLGLSYINLSSLTNAGGSFPLQITLNNATGNNGTHQLTIPTATLNSLSQEVQIAQNYQISSQVKFEADINVSGGQQHQMQQSQLSIVTCGQDVSDNDDKAKRKPRRRIPNKSAKTIAANNENTHPPGQTAGPEERLLDHKGRPFIYNCPDCPKKFTLNSRLTAHLRCHTGIRPYTCSQCGFSFTQKSYLIRHAAVHTEERPFTCERCLKTYKHYGSLANHRKLHRKEDQNGTSDVSDSHCPSEQHKPAVTDQANFDGILQLHSDWSTVAGDNAYLIATSATTAADNSSGIAYYTESPSVTHVLSGTGPVAFPEQQLAHSLDSAATASGQGFCASNPCDNTVFMDLQMLPASSSLGQTLNGNENILYTHVDLAGDQSQQQQNYSTTFSTTNTV